MTGDGGAGWLNLFPFRNKKNPARAYRKHNRARGLSILPEDAERLIDDTIIAVGTDRLVVVRDIMEAGLVTPLPQWLSIMRLDGYRTGISGNARQIMHLGARTERHLPEMDKVGVPIYATESGFELDVRTLAVSERVGMPLDSTLYENSTRAVNETIEYGAINGAVTEEGYESPGLFNAPGVGDYSFTDGKAWDDPTKTPAGIVADVLGMSGELADDKKPGPYILWLPRNFNRILDEDYATPAGTVITIRQRLELIKPDGIRPIKISVPDLFPTDKLVMAQLSKETMDVIVGQEPEQISWADPSGRALSFAVTACIVPRFRDDFDGKSGILVGHA